MALGNQSGQFLAIIKMALEGNQQVVGGLQQTQQAVNKLSKTKITTIYDPQGVVTGKQIEETFTSINKNVAKAKPIMAQFGDAMKRALIVAPVWMIMRGAIQAVTNTMQDQVKFLIELETAMARIRIVGKGTEEEYKNLQTTLVGLAYTYGTTASEAAQAAVIFAQQGRTAKETAELTRTAMLASKILGTDIRTAVDDMTAAIEGFQLGIGESINIVDKWINVEKQFAVTSKDLADATKVAGASANQLGLTMSEFLGDVTAVVEVTRKSGAEAARGLSFIYARLLTSGKETIEQITKIPFYLDETGKATAVMGTQLRNISDILEELAGKWETLTTQEKLEIATALGSKRQMVVLNALMQNYNASLDARIAALTSAGAAEKAFAIIQDTTEIKLKQVSAAWNVLTTAIGDTTGFKTLLSIFDRMIINLAALISYEKAYGAMYTREINKVLLSIETRREEVKSLEELLAIREKLAKAPQTEANEDRLKKVEDAIAAIVAKEPKIKIAIETTSKTELTKAIRNRVDELNLEHIRKTASIDFEPRIAGLEETKATILRELQFTGGTRAIELRTNLAKVETEIKQVYIEQDRTIKDQYKIQRGQEIARQGIVDEAEEETNLSAELTVAEKERLSIETELIKIRSIGNISLTEQVQKEIELVQNAKYLYNAHDKNVKLSELENELVDAKVKDIEREINNELTILSLRGASAKQLLVAKSAILESVFGEDAVRRNLELQLELRKEQTKEMLNQVDVSSESIALYKLAQKEGTQTAKIVGQFLTGAIDYGALEQNKKALEAFKEFFSSRAEALEAAKFLGIPFRGYGGNVGAPGGRYTGALGGDIPIPEFNLPQFNMPQIQIPAITTQIGNVNIDIKQSITKALTEENLPQQITDDIANEIRNNIKIKQAIKEQIEEF